MSTVVSGERSAEQLVTLHVTRFSQDAPDACAATIAMESHRSGRSSATVAASYRLNIAHGKSSATQTSVRFSGEHGVVADMHMGPVVSKDTVFSYVGMHLAPGQTIRGASAFVTPASTMAIGSGGNTTKIEVPKVKGRFSARVVGNAAMLHTALGGVSAFPIRYTVSTDATSTQFLGTTLPIPAATTRVTQWYAPSIGLIVRAEVEVRRTTAVSNITAYH